jgi:hypothetical protein
MDEKKESRKEVTQMNTVPAGTVIGYDADSGEKLFTEINRATRRSDQTITLPQVNEIHTFNGKTYRIVGVRKGSIETLCEIDVREEPSK